MGLLDIFSGNRYHFNNEISPTYGDIYNRIDDAIKDLTNSDKDILKKVIELLLTSSFIVIDFMFGENGFKKEYLKKIDRAKTRKLLATLYGSYYLSLKDVGYFRKIIRNKISRDDIYLVYTRLFGDNLDTIKNLIEELSNLDSMGRMTRLIKKIYQIVLGAEGASASSGILQDSMMLAPCYASTFQGSFEVLTK